MTFLTPPAPVVVDASITVGLASGEEPAVAVALEAARSGAMLLAPAHIWIETANALLRGKRRTVTGVIEVLEDMARAGIESTDRGLVGLRGAIGLAAEHGLSVYDAAYLWLAIDLDGSLATLDGALARAAETEGVPVLGVDPGPEPAFTPRP